MHLVEKGAKLLINGIGIFIPKPKRFWENNNPDHC